MSRYIPDSSKILDFNALDRIILRQALTEAGLYP